MYCMSIFIQVSKSNLILLLHSRLDGGGPVLGWGGGPALSSALDPATGGTPRALHPPAFQFQNSMEASAWEAMGHEGTSYDLYRFYATRGFQSILENPIRTIGMLLTKTFTTVGALPVPDSLSPVFLVKRQAPLFGYLRFSFALLFGLGMAGLLKGRRDALRQTLFSGVIAVGAGSLLGMTSAASREAALPLLAALGGGWLAGPSGFLSPRPTLRSVAIVVGGATVSLLAGFLSPAARLQNPSEDLRLEASTFSESGSWRQAVPLLEEWEQRLRCPGGAVCRFESHRWERRCGAKCHFRERERWHQDSGTRRGQYDHRQLYRCGSLWTDCDAEPGTRYHAPVGR